VVSGGELDPELDGAGLSWLLRMPDR
jgi:hypothetical protein